MKRDYLPIEVETIEKENFWDIIPTEIKRKIWYMDISKLTISELIELRNELMDIQKNSTQILDGIIYNETGTARNRNQRQKETKNQKKQEKIKKHNTRKKNLRKYKKYKNNH